MHHTSKENNLNRNPNRSPDRKIKCQDLIYLMLHQQMLQEDLLHQIANMWWNRRIYLGLCLEVHLVRGINLKNQESLFTTRNRKLENKKVKVRAKTSISLLYQARTQALKNKKFM